MRTITQIHAHNTALHEDYRCELHQIETRFAQQRADLTTRMNRLKAYYHQRQQQIAIKYREERLDAARRYNEQIAANRTELNQLMHLAQQSQEGGEA
ncbi:hypothetical protein [Sodaliphilus sp.]|uniref:hypothetical protein n=1 Tax=Sodaliphilus sp. TaxID=2815818 RepID=UPI00388F514C